ncbi:hypothetical protein KFU94_13910 [Chloroflexi bacterium TSY]|nr:hypothetical protein [Chloroflexi bacterium TSY]
MDRNPSPGAGLIQTGPTELSLYVSRLNRHEECHARRYSLRLDGFVSVEGPYRGWGEFTTPLITFSGRQLALNYSTSGGGSIFVELQDAAGTPVPGFALDDCVEIFGDKIEGVVRWQSGKDIYHISNQAVRLHVRLRDAHLYAFQFIA